MITQNRKVFEPRRPFGPQFEELLPYRIRLPRRDFLFILSLKGLIG